MPASPSSQVPVKSGSFVSPSFLSSLYILFQLDTIPYSSSCKFTLYYRIDTLPSPSFTSLWFTVQPSTPIQLRHVRLTEQGSTTGSNWVNWVNWVLASFNRLSHASPASSSPSPSPTTHRCRLLPDAGNLPTTTTTTTKHHHL